MFPSDQELTALIKGVKTIAVVGAKDKPGQPADTVGRYLVAAGFRVLPVHPTRSDVWGLATYKSILDAPGPIDLVDLFRAPQACPEHARECLKLARLPKVFWMQLGIESPEVPSILAGRPITVVQDRCLMVEHKRLFGRARRG